MNPTDPSQGHSFFDWQENAKSSGSYEVRVDFSLVLPHDTADKNNIYGYAGTDTMPGCDSVCWYIIETPQVISQAQLDFFKMQDLASNARQIGLGDDTYEAFFFWYGKDAPTPTPKSEENGQSDAEFLQI